MSEAGRFLVIVEHAVVRAVCVNFSNNQADGVAADVDPRQADGGRGVRRRCRAEGHTSILIDPPRVEARFDGVHTTFIHVWALYSIELPFTKPGKGVRSASFRSTK